MISSGERSSFASTLASKGYSFTNSVSLVRFEKGLLGGFKVEVIAEDGIGPVGLEKETDRVRYRLSFGRVLVAWPAKWVDVAAALEFVELCERRAESAIRRWSRRICPRCEKNLSLSGSDSVPGILEKDRKNGGVWGCWKKAACGFKWGGYEAPRKAVQDGTVRFQLDQWCPKCSQVLYWRPGEDVLRCSMSPRCSHTKDGAEVLMEKMMEEVPS